MSCAPHRLLRGLVAPALALGLFLCAGTPAWAQFFDESLERDDLFLQDDERFFEDRGDDFGEPGQQDFSEGNQFIDESLIPADQRSLTRGGRQFQLTLGQDRESLPVNVAWGAGTGLLIGGWFALINEGDNRDTQRSIGVGIVAGILLGVAVGTRSVFNPDAPRPATGQAKPPPAPEGPQFTPLVSLAPQKSALGFRMTF